MSPLRAPTRSLLPRLKAGRWVPTPASRSWARYQSFKPSSRLRHDESLTSNVPSNDGILTTLFGKDAPRAQSSGLAAASQSFSPQVDIKIDGKAKAFDTIFLRDSCKCSRCVDPSSTQKNFETAEIPGDIEGSVQIVPDVSGSEWALISWKNDIPDWPADHQTALPIDFLRQAVGKDSVVQPSLSIPLKRTLWDSATMTRDNKFIDYNEYMKSDGTLYEALKMLYTHGLVFLENVPDTIATDSSTSVASVVERIGSIRHTFYGRTWNVKSVPEAKNVAYTHVYLGLHMDLCYMDNTPHLQFLHSMRARAPGGESMFSDSFLAAETMRRETPELFDALRTFGVTYNYFNAGEAYRQVRPTVVLEDQNDPNSAIQWLNWSPPFQGPIAQDIGLQDGGKALRLYHAAAQRFSKLVNSPENVFELRMKEGQCVIFDNRRALHARRAFEADKGERWLKGAYMDRDAYQSKLMVLGEAHGW